MHYNVRQLVGVAVIKTLLLFIANKPFLQGGVIGSYLILNI